MQSVSKLSLLSLTVVTVTLGNLTLNATAHNLKFAQTPEEVGLSSTKLELLSQDIQKLVDANNIPGAVGLIIRHGKIVYHQGFGLQHIEKNIPIQKDSIFRIASNSKVITSFAASLLIEDGLINLQDPVAKYISSFANMEVLVPGESGNFNDFTTIKAKDRITIKDLLNHTSGLDYNLNNNPYLAPLLQENNISDGYSTTSGTLEEMVDRLSEIPLLFEPGTQFSYGLSTDVLGRVVEVASGQSLDEFLAERIFEPLGMSKTGFSVTSEQEKRLTTLYTNNNEGDLIAIGGTTQEITPGVFIDADYPLKTGDSYFSGGAGLTSTPEDFATFLQMLLNNGKVTAPNNQKKISIANPETVKQFISISDKNFSLEGSIFDSFFHWENYSFTNGLAVKNNSDTSDTPG